MVDMVDSVLQCHGCDTDLCPFHVPARCLRLNLCAVCERFERSRSESSESDDDGDVQYESESERSEFYLDPWLAEYDDDVVIAPSPKKRPRPAPPSLIVDAVRAHADTDPSDTCSICLDAFKDGQAHVLPCSTKHAFHKPCIVRWLEREHASCPVCNTTLQT
jgi:hypothetical protein